MSPRAGLALERLGRLVPALWLGVLLSVGLLAAPALFALLERPAAGRVAARLFSLEAQASLLLGVALALIERRRAVAGGGPQLSAELLLVLGAVFCTVLGHFALQPMMQAARAGEGRWSFAALHGASTALFATKTLFVAALAWRASMPCTDPPGATGSR